MTLMKRREHTGLRTADKHASWREVYSQMDVNTEIQEVSHEDRK